jgi:hypothetical protein
MARAFSIWRNPVRKRSSLRFNPASSGRTEIRNWKLETGKRAPAEGLKRAGGEKTGELQILVSPFWYRVLASDIRFSIPQLPVSIFHFPVSTFRPWQLRGYLLRLDWCRM